MMTNGSMTKAELVEEVSRVSDLTKKHSEVIVDTVFRSIIEALHRGEKIELRGFGSFRLRKREPRKGRNPKTGDKVDVPPKKVPYFKPGKELKELINKEAPPPIARADRRRARCLPTRWRSNGSRDGASSTCRQPLATEPRRYGTPLVSLETGLRDRRERRRPGCIFCDALEPEPRRARSSRAAGCPSSSSISIPTTTAT